MLFVPVFSHQFYLLYLLCGFTDMVDGIIARKTKSVTPFGSGLDSVADFVFAVAAFVKLLPALSIPIWLWNCIFCHRTRKNHKSRIGISAEPAIDL